MRYLTPLAAAAVFFAAAAHAQNAGDPARGQSLAREHCARCHDVEPGGAFKQHPPSFASVAVFRSEEQIRGRIWFPPLHSSMPTMVDYLTPRNVGDLVAYILSLEPK